MFIYIKIAYNTTLSVANTACHPLPKFRVARLREEAAVVGIIRIRVSISIRISGIRSVLVLPVPLLLLANVNQHEKSRRQADNEKTLEHSLVDVKLQVIVVAVVVVLRVEASPNEILVIFSGLIEFLPVLGLVVPDKGSNPFAEGEVGSRIYKSC